MLRGDKEGIYVYEELIHLLYSRNWDNIVKQLNSNKNYIHTYTYIYHLS